MKFSWVYMKQKFKVSQWIIFGILLHETISKVSNEILFGVLVIVVVVLLHETILRLQLNILGFRRKKLISRFQWDICVSTWKQFQRLRWIFFGVYMKEFQGCSDLL
jgi:hypothetical protein